jgi:NAD+ kinase
MRGFSLGSDADRGSVGVLVTPSVQCRPQLLMIEAWAAAQGVAVVDLGTSAAPNGLGPGCGLVVALGGDGTILRALQLAMPHHVGVLGIATLGTGPPRTVVAFNDVVVARRPGHGTARLRVEVDGEALLELRGDGVVIASPTGSTAYNVGAGGPAVAPSLDAIVVTPLATQGSRLRSLVLDGGDTVCVATEPSSAPLSAEIDGRTIYDLPMPGVIEVQASPHKARLVRTRPRTFYSDLARGL